MPTTGIPPLGVTRTPDGTRFTVWSHNAARIDLCLFDEAGNTELSRLPMQRDGDVHSIALPDIAAGTRYGLRAEGSTRRTTGFGSIRRNFWSTLMRRNSTGPFVTTSG